MGLLLAAVAVVVATSVVGVVDASGQPVDELVPPTTAPAPTVPEPTVVPVVPDAPDAPDVSDDLQIPQMPETPGENPPLISAAPAPPGPPEPDPSPRIRVSLARLAVIDAERALALQQGFAAMARDGEAAAQAAVDGAAQARTDAEGQLREARDQLRSTAVYAYMHTPGGDFVPELRGDATAGGQERHLFAAAVDHHTQGVADADGELEGATADLDVARQALDGARQAATDQDNRVAEASSALADTRSELRTATAGERRPTTSWQLSLQGPTVFTVDELVRWYEAQGHGSRASVPIAELVRLFIDHGNAEGIRGDMAFAQAIHETGWFANRDTITQNNFAGIGHCDSCAAGFPFATADVGALAQIQLLKGYSETNPTYNVPRAAPNLNGPRGCCQTWTELGGVWATDPNYGPRILGNYDDMLAWLVAERSAAT